MPILTKKQVASLLKMNWKYRQPMVHNLLCTIKALWKENDALLVELGRKQDVDSTK